jgi:choline dehydrogenase-like flavoprotein
MWPVVDSRCRVKGLEGVIAVDSLILHNPLGVHFQAGVYAVAEMICETLF